jgi:LmbE family N-acetylglucosaminyl deacetylase
MRVLCFQPHDDDVCIGLGGSICKMREKGWKIGYVYVTDGRHGSQTIAPQKLVQLRRRESLKERELIGIQDYYELGIEDGTVFMLSKEQEAHLKATIRDILDLYMPDIVVLPTRGEQHPDHRGTHDLVIDSINDLRMNALIVKYMVWLYPDFYQKAQDTAERVLMVGVDNQISKKISLIRLHRSQIQLARFDLMSRTCNRYFALVFNAPEKIGERHVEILGLFNISKQGETLSKLTATLQKCADITTVFQGRLSAQIQI